MCPPRSGNRLPGLNINGTRKPVFPRRLPEWTSDRYRSIFKLPGGTAAEAALVVAPEFQGLGRGGEKGVGGLLLDDLVQYARDQQLQGVTAYLPVHNPRCERLLRKYGVEMSVARLPEQETSAWLDLCAGR